MGQEYILYLKLQEGCMSLSCNFKVHAHTRLGLLKVTAYSVLQMNSCEEIKDEI